MNAGLVFLAAWVGALIGTACSLMLPRTWAFVLKLAASILLTLIAMVILTAINGD